MAALWVEVAFLIARRMACGTLRIELAGGVARTFRGPCEGPAAVLRLNRVRAIRRFVTGGALGLAEAYLDGDWDSPDLPRLLEHLALNLKAYAGKRRRAAFLRALLRLCRFTPARNGSGARPVRFDHYELGNTFFALWLDPSLTYSGALFGDAGRSLEQAQAAKLGKVAERLGLGPEHHLLEIGCGWGSFAEFAGREIGARVTAITTSRQQYAYACARMQRLGLRERVAVRLQDVRTLDGRFDRIAAIEVLESVGESGWPAFFRQLDARLAPGGRAALQVITIADERFAAYRRREDFIRRHVFPGGMLPSARILDRLIRNAGLRKLDEETFGLDYARTLAAWNRRFQAAQPAAGALGLDARFRRLWSYYLASCEAGFRAGFTDVAQFTLARA